MNVRCYGSFELPGCENILHLWTVNFHIKKKSFYLVFKLISKDHKKKWPLIFHSSKYITYSNN